MPPMQQPYSGGMVPNSFVDMLRRRQQGFAPPVGQQPMPAWGANPPQPIIGGGPMPVNGQPAMPVQQPQMPIQANSFLRRPMGAQLQ